jgi:hypothetical protein
MKASFLKGYLKLPESLEFRKLFQAQRTEPPFTFKTSPVICRARPEARNNIGPATPSRGGILLKGIDSWTLSLGKPWNLLPSVGA